MNEHYQVEELANLAEDIRNTSLRYENLFNKLAKQILVDLREAYTKDGLAPAYKLSEQAIGDFQQYFPSPEKFACRAGCNSCCTLPVQVPAIVIGDIAKFIDAHFSNEDKNDLLARLRQRVKVISGPKQACPLLDSDGQCTVYEARPPACRAFTSSNKMLCDEAVRSDAYVPQNPTHFQIHQALTTALVVFGQEQQLDAEQVDFLPKLLESLGG